MQYTLPFTWRPKKLTEFPQNKASYDVIISRRTFLIFELKIMQVFYSIQKNNDFKTAAFSYLMTQI